MLLFTYVLTVGGREMSGECDECGNHALECLCIMVPKRVTNKMLYKKLEYLIYEVKELCSTQSRKHFKELSECNEYIERNMKGLNSMILEVKGITAQLSSARIRDKL